MKSDSGPLEDLIDAEGNRVCDSYLEVQNLILDYIELSCQMYFVLFIDSDQ